MSGASHGIDASRAPESVPDRSPGVPPTESTPAWHLYRALVGVGIVCGVLIVAAFEMTRPIIAQNRAEALQRAIFDVLPGVERTASFAFAPDGKFTALGAGPEGGHGGGSEAEVVHAGYDGSGQLVGLAIEARGMGYQDVITVLYGYSISDGAIVGFSVLDSRETPGLGDKIDKDPVFLENFVRLDASLNDAGNGLAHDIEAVKHGEKTSAWQIDAITGATISSNAVADILNTSAAHWAPRVAQASTAFEL